MWKEHESLGFWLKLVVQERDLLIKEASLHRFIFPLYIFSARRIIFLDVFCSIFPFLKAFFLSVRHWKLSAAQETKDFLVLFRLKSLTLIVNSNSRKRLALHKGTGELLTLPFGEKRQFASTNKKAFQLKAYHPFANRCIGYTYLNPFPLPHRHLIHPTTWTCSILFT